MLQQFRTFASTSRLDLDDLIALLLFGKQFRLEYEEWQLEVPAYVEQQINVLRREIQVRVADQLEARRVEIRSRLNSLKTRDERKADLLAEDRKLKQKKKSLAIQ